MHQVRVALLLCLAGVLAACGGSKTASTTSATTAANQATAAPQSAGSSQNIPRSTVAAARIDLSGKFTFKHSAGVSSCDVHPAGHSLMSGYSLNFTKDEAIESGGLHLASYHGDGTYEVPVHVKSFAEDPLQLSLLARPGLPHGSTLQQAKSSTLSVDVSHGGKAGVARLQRWSMLYPDGAVVSGTIAWTCP